MPSEDERAPKNAKASDRLHRLLVVVPFLVQHPGSEVKTVAELFGVDEAALVADLNLLFLTGLPPYGPGDLIGVDLEDGRVWIDMADHFSRPLKLTRTEALALYLRGTALAAAPGLHEAPALSSALAKLRDGLGSDALSGLHERVEAAPGGRPAETLDALREAVVGHERVEIEYYAASTAETTMRRVDPEEVFFAIGNWYVAAWDDLSGEERLFRADRIRRVSPTGEGFEPRGLPGAGRPLYTPGETDVPVRLLLRPGARWVAEYYDTESETELGHGDLEVVLRAGRLEWVARLVLRLGEDALVLHPAGLKDRIRELASLTLERYE